MLETNQKVLYTANQQEDIVAFSVKLSSIQFNSIQFYLYSAKLQQLSSQGT